ncbi:hypothetical protein J7M23_05035 [Candidatus Sumerlaeota bacterium]|nr:hypothetical protein [Candidatus Sumerlaeota bacterium]
MIKMKHIFSVFLSMLIVCSIALSAMAQEDAIKIRTPQIISTDSTENTNVKILAAPDGRIYVIWQGKKNERFHIFFREKIGENWLEPIMVDDVKENDDYDPAFFVDKDSNPHIVWVSKQNQTQEIHYAYRIGTDWIFNPPIRSSQEYNLECPSIIVGQNGNPFIAWQEGKGIAYTIWCSFEDSKGNIQTRPVSEPDSDHYNIYPQLFVTPMSPMLLWYEAQEEGFVLRSAAFIKDVEKWVDYPLDGMQLLPTNRLPILYSTKKGNFFAVWYDNIDGVDHIMFGTQDQTTQCAGIIVDDGSTLNNSLPSAVAGNDDEVYICWRADMETLFSQIFLTKISNNKPGKTILLSDGIENYYSHPDMTIDKNGRFNIVWFSNAREGGDGAIYYTTVEF